MNWYTTSANKYPIEIPYKTVNIVNFALIKNPIKPPNKKPPPNISGQFINPFQYFHIGVRCKEKCNYILTISLINNIKIEEKEINSFTLESKSIMKLSFTTKKHLMNYLLILSGFI